MRILKARTDHERVALKKLRLQHDVEKQRLERLYYYSNREKAM